MLDARQPGTPGTPTTATPFESAEKATEDAEVARLLHETRLWRLANTAQWVAWGIVQAKVPGMPDFSGEAASTADGPASEPLLENAGREALAEQTETVEALARSQTATTEEDEEEAHDEEFDYLGYAQHRAMFFWGDILQLGLVKEEDVPEELRARVKVVPY
jgi:choline kinase